MACPNHFGIHDKIGDGISVISAVHRSLLKMTIAFYPQFRHHNAHSVAAIIEMAGNQSGFEFQRLACMGNPCTMPCSAMEKVRSRIYASGRETFVNCSLIC